MKIVTVLRSGGDFAPDHAIALQAQCKRHAPGVEFLCLTDFRDVPGRRSLTHRWPGWWSKIEAFRVPGPALYMDLDTVVTGDLGPLLEVARREWFTVLRDFNPQQRELGTGLMAWSGDLSIIYRRFLKDPAGHMAANSNPRHWGDQGFIERQPEPRGYWQEHVPGMVVSWKKHCLGGRIPEGARVVCFHGEPRPWAVGQFGHLYRDAA